MGPFVKGEVVVLPFPFSDLSSLKRRPALILASPKKDEVIVCQITTQSSRPEYTVKLEDRDFKNGGLGRDSYIRPNHIFTAEPDIIISSRGNLLEDKIQDVIDELIKILQEK